MTILEAWKKQKGKGVYVDDKTETTNIVLNNLITGIKKTGNTIRIISTSDKLAYYKKLYDVEVLSYDNVLFNNSNVFLLILMDIHRVYENNIIGALASNGYKYLFCTATNADKIKDYKLLKLAPVIEFHESVIRSRKIVSGDINIYNVQLDMQDDARTIYNKYSDTMNEIFSYFDGSFSTMNNCHKGDVINGITGDVFRRDFSRRHGWTTELDLSVEYYKSIDTHYNPNAVYEKAKLYFDILAKRNHFIDEHTDKCYYVNNVMRQYNDKRYIILCKNNYMADKIAEFITKNNSKYVAKAIHKDLKPVCFYDIERKVITYGKTSSKAGQPKKFGYKTQMKNYLNWFNSKTNNVLVITNAIEKGILLKDVDVIIRLSDKSLMYEELSKRVNLVVNPNFINMNVYFSATKEDDKTNAKYKSTEYNVKYFHKENIVDLSL